MFNPIATYRIQFHAGFTFQNFQAIIPYLDELGIKTIYASPIFDAVPGSMHGYDGTNPHRINPEIGTLQELKQIARALKKRGMYWIQDIVPNHMAFHPSNAWLMDVLRKGEKSNYRQYFDIVSGDLEKEPLMLPFLGADLDEVIASGELQLHKISDTYFFKYHDQEWPLSEGTDASLSLSDILSRQFYRPCSYRETNERINYRRFFTVNNLICLNMQHEEVFQDYHSLIKELIVAEVFQGLRIDHVDGLYDPAGYLQRLRSLCGTETYIVVEKILEPGETLPKSWPIQGTTGYDYLGLVNQLFTNEEAVKQFNSFYRGLQDQHSPLEQQIRKKKRDFLLAFMQGELDNLYRLFCRLNAEKGVRNVAMDLGVFKTLIAEVMVHCPVYRFYGNQFPLQEEEKEALKQLLSSLELGKEYEEALEQLRWMLMEGNISFFQRLMQFTGPLMAKGVEDTLMYTYNRFIGNNEVGDSPGVFGISASAFHQAIQERQRDWPLSMNATATHDTKRAEDARARLNALTYLQEDWLTAVRHWRELNAGLKTAEMPDANDEYFIYQSLVASFPDDQEEMESYPDRLQEYLQKALRESKRNSEWENPDQEYEAATQKFIRGLLAPKGNFQSAFKPLQRKVSAAGRLLSLSSLILKMCVPGLPDVYQGTELWDLSMVDPDNRRAVDYQRRSAYLSGTSEVPAKLSLMQELLQLRKAHPLLFTSGLYLPLELRGKYATKLIAFARKYGKELLLVAVPLDPSIIDKGHRVEWGDTLISLPDREVSLQSLCADKPYLLHYFEKENSSRTAGVLLPLSSLPSNFGIGDFGPSAQHFLELLAESGQRYWQMLPLNPITATQSFSPYSATSVMAGNIMLISPEGLQHMGLLTQDDLEKYTMKSGRKLHYKKVLQSKTALLNLAFENYKMYRNPALQIEFEDFCEQESAWLGDYASYEAIKSEQDGREWFKWPSAYRNRDKKALTQFVKEKSGSLEMVKWQQFIFFKQWRELKQSAEILGIGLIGDLPFYTALDSADVWSNPDLFSIAKDGRVKGMAGVPPDYFNEEGQLWGMPVYNWEVMAKKGYRWWIERIAKNLEMYHQVRLDHFRAFSAYWEVPAGTETAKNGAWRPGPGADLFEALKKHFDVLPFIAEDLGEIDENVYALRDQYALPGMRVLQFAFGEDIAESIHAAHNFEDANSVVYTGTHDNNTLLGWYRQELDAKSKKRLETYVGHHVTERNILKTMLRLAYSSSAKMAIIPMQDLLKKGAKGRMNTPASVSGNWTWRMKPEEMQVLRKKRFKNMLKLFGR
ncbi:malto-oligosyltrehalose synthase [Pedobacter sp. GR22-6]|uniref:malto-oligosyltrehalose synthase n=1 Tax=Pedobacter sp. GR22-6 TaxID=3127957 RepID=UPI00307EFE5B